MKLWKCLLYYVRYFQLKIKDFAILRRMCFYTIQKVVLSIINVNYECNVHVSQNIEECKNYTCWLIFVYRPQICARSFARSFARSLARSLAWSLARSLTHSLAQSLAWSLAWSLAQSLTLKFSPKFRQKFSLKFSPKFSPKFGPKFRLKSVWLFAHHPIPNAKFQPITL